MLSGFQEARSGLLREPCYGWWGGGGGGGGGGRRFPYEKVNTLDTLRFVAHKNNRAVIP